jgi:hypothetical protein
MSGDDLEKIVDLMVVKGKGKREMKPSRQPSQRLRAHIHDYYHGMCVFCPPEKGPLAKWHCDHFSPWSKSKDGGIPNFVVTCEKHNSLKSDDDPEVWLRLMKTVNHEAYLLFWGTGTVQHEYNPFACLEVKDVEDK